MKSIITLIITTVSLMTFAQAHSNSLSDHMAVAGTHLDAIGGRLEVASETDNQIFIWELYAIDDEDHPCHVGVVIEKETLKVVEKEFDKDLQLSFPYADTFYKANSIIHVCAD